jgi:hypothetical protein
MNKKNIMLILFFCLIFGASAVLFFYQVYELLILKKTHELVTGNIDNIGYKKYGKTETYWLICSYTYNDQLYNKKVYVENGIPFFSSIYKEYPKGETIFMLDYEKDIIFPQNNINLEMRRRIFPLILSIIAIALIISIRVYIK